MEGAAMKGTGRERGAPAGAGIDMRYRKEQKRK